MNATPNNGKLYSLQRTVFTLLLAAVLASGHSFGASTFGEGTKSTPRAVGKISGKLIINGSIPMAPMIAEIAKRFEVLHPGTQIEVHNEGSVEGLRDVREGKATVGMLTRVLTDQESYLTAYPVARDAVCIIIHKDNLVISLTSQQIRDIYLGRITNWKNAGGSDAGIDVIHGTSGTGSVDMFLRYFRIKDDALKTGKVLRLTPDRIKAVHANRNAIAYVSVGAAERTMKAGVPIKLLPAEGVSATSRSLRRGQFPISRPLTLITKGTQSELTREFIRYALSSNVNGIIEKHDFVAYRD